MAKTTHISTPHLRIKDRVRLHFGRDDWRFLWNYVRPRFRSIVFTGLGFVLVNHMTLINLWVVAFVIGKVIPSGDYSKVLWLGAFFISTLLLVSFLSARLRREMDESIGSLVNDIRKDLMVSILHGFDMGVFQSDTRLSQSRIVNEACQLKDAVVMLLGQTVPALVLICTSLLLVGGIDIELMLVLLVTIPSFLILLRVLGATLQRKLRRKNHAENRYRSHLSLVLHFLDHIRIRMSEPLEVRLHAHRFKEMQRSNVGLTVVLSGQSMANSVFHSIVFLAVFLLGSRSVMDGGMGVERLVVLFLAVNILYSMSGSLLAGYSKLLSMWESLRELRGRISDYAQSYEWQGMSPMPASGCFSFRKVSFGYPDHPVLIDMDYDLMPGACLALVGSNGISFRGAGLTLQ